MKEKLTEIIVVHDDNLGSDYAKEKLIKIYKDFFSSIKEINNENEIKNTLITYGSKYITVFENQDYPKIRMKNIGSKPNGSHPVFDSAVRAIDELGERYSKTDDDLKPSDVILILTAFGKDNASKHNTISAVRKRITHQSEVYKWKIFFVTDNTDYSEEFDADTVLIDIEEDDYFTNFLTTLSDRISDYLKNK